MNEASEPEREDASGNLRRKKRNSMLVALLLLGIAVVIFVLTLTRLKVG